MLEAGVLVQAGKDGGLVLKRKILRGAGFLERFRPPVTEKSFELDEFGAFVVGQIDGKKTVLDIIGTFQERFKMSRRESELGVVAFMKILLKRTLVVIVADEKR